jgi:DNA-binding CsgD family transcriptional regulator
MDFEALSEVVFRLGRASSDASLCNQSLLREIAEATARFVGCETLCVVAHCDGVMKPATACYAHGPWSVEENDRFLERFRWSARDRVLAMRLADRAPNRFYRRRELIDESDFRESRVYLEFERPMSLGDSALGVFESSGGGVLVMSIGMLEGHGALTDEQVMRARAVAPFVSDCWTHGWKHEPRWVVDLKSHSREVLQLVLEGLDDDQIADETGLTYHSVRAHLERLFKEAGVRSRLHLMQAYRGVRLNGHAPGALANTG